MQHKTKRTEHFLPIRVFLNSLNNDIVESNSVVVLKNKLQKYPLEIHSHNYNEVVLIGGPGRDSNRANSEIHLLEILH
jgi:hypothetical protein